MFDVPANARRYVGYAAPPPRRDDHMVSLKVRCYKSRKVILLMFCDHDIATFSALSLD